ncbi:putative membrane protein [Geothermobacter ehrlichii]|uniref:Putative membrane protein n=1 Tax=Geothermobacter ehrlichii TaxID=213224 RepID=A0A5D3WHR1_9BACT|nr:TPM domain-containing protein [Geothermobacter ehrlichii]TYO97100.1 putative membrane protein [Geothermobacter ehrlichii]
MPETTASTFFSEEERRRIEQAVRQVEERTSGEIVPLIVDASYDYPRAELIGAGCFSLASALFACWLIASESIWIFLPFWAAFFAAFWLLIRRVPALKRRLIPPAEIDAEVEEKALVSFLQYGLHQTRDRTGVLILISLFERRVHILADKGINEKVPPGTWDELVHSITAGIRGGTACQALCDAIHRCGELLEKDFPRREDDADELPNLIVE